MAQKNTLSVLLWAPASVGEHCMVCPKRLVVTWLQVKNNECHSHSLDHVYMVYYGMMIVFLLASRQDFPKNKSIQFLFANHVGINKLRSFLLKFHSKLVFNLGSSRNFSLQLVLKLVVSMQFKKLIFFS